MFTKAAAKKMAVAVFEMYRASNAKNLDVYLDRVYNDWVIKVDVTVGDESWYDVYNANPTLKAHPNVTTYKYPLNAVATQIVFTAQAAKTPTVEDIAKNLQIPETKMGPIATALAEFNQFMDEAATFELNQAVPPGFGATHRSPVTTTMTPLTGLPVSKASTTTPYKKKVKGKAATKPMQPVAATVPCYLTLAGSTAKVALTAGGDNEIGSSSKGFPWATKTTDLEDDTIFYITTQRSGGPAIVSLEPGVDVKIKVNGTTLTGRSRLSLHDGEKMQVYDSYAPGGFYEFTFVQQ